MVLIRLRKVALTVAARCSGVAPSIGVFYQDGRPNGGHSVTRTGRGDSCMDDPRSLLESNQIFSIKRRGHTDPEEPHVDILHVVLDRGQKTINS